LRRVTNCLRVTALHHKQQQNGADALEANHNDLRVFL
jgi:hypothetical protein